MPIRLPASCGTFTLLESSESSLSSAASSSLALVALADFFDFADFAAAALLPAFVDFAPLLFFAGAVALALVLVGSGAAAAVAGAGMMKAITFCRKMATTGQSGDLLTVEGMMARSATRLESAWALASAPLVGTSCKRSRS